MMCNVARPLRRAVFGVLAAAASLAALAAEPVRAVSGGLSRDAIWRDIFKRQPLPPSGLPPDVETARERLGARLFADPRLSGDGDRACASCHDPGRGFGNGAPRGLARDGSALPRNVPHLWNLAWAKALFWDGRAASLAAQARVPIEDPREMAGDLTVIAERLSGDSDMVALFSAAFPSETIVSGEQVLAALAAYERTLVSPPSRFDLWVEGQETALTARELAGFRIFTGKGGCVACHGGWRFTDDGFHDIGLRSPDPGRGAVAGGVPGLAAFKTPGLREIARTAPYMHDGSLADLAAVVDHYAGGLERRQSLSTSLPAKLELEDDEKRALIAFLATLSSDPPALPSSETAPR